MKKNNLVPNKGLSLSQAQSISNLCNQRAKEIENTILTINNCSKKVSIGDKAYETMKGVKIPNNIVDLLMEKSKLHACQAFLMENIKAKTDMLEHTRTVQPDVSSVEFPVKPDLNHDEFGKLLDLVDEDWAWEELTTSDLNEYLEAEAFASHIGQFIHKNGKLDILRKELLKIPEIEWMNIEDGKKTPVAINVHHEPKDLLEVHEELAKLHHQYEQRVNYYKAKVKNLMTEENATIVKHNADIEIKFENKFLLLSSEYETKVNKANGERKIIYAEFEKTRRAKIKEIVSMRINIDARFQETIDMFLDKTEDNK